MQRQNLKRVLRSVMLLVGLSYGGTASCLAASGLAGHARQATPSATTASAVTNERALPDEWRRTATGWERLEEFELPVSPSCAPWCNVTQLHPAVVTAMITLVSLGALVATSSDSVITMRSASERSKPNGA